MIGASMRAPLMGQGASVQDALDRGRRSHYLAIQLFNHTAQCGMSSPDRLSTTLAALADPTRRAILARLALGESSVKALAEPFAMSLPAVSKHLKVLERAGLITRSREAQWRPCRLDAGPLREVADWLEHYRRFWGESLDRLDDYLQAIQADGPDGGGNA
jgi:DNA-binding transcriptional ArsR family regulator